MAAPYNFDPNQGAWDIPFEDLVSGGQKPAQYVGAEQSPWQVGIPNGQMNVWNSSQNDGSVPWDVAMQLGIGPGAMYGAGGGSGSASRLYANTGSDSYLNAALNRLQGTVNGTNLPFDATTRANMLSKASDMNAASEASNAEDVRARAAAGGGSLNDPASQAALAKLKSTRQQGNQSAAQAIDSQANVANFQAQENAAGNLANTRLQQAQIDPYYSGTPRTFTGTSWGAGGSAPGGAAGGSGPNGASYLTGVPGAMPSQQGTDPYAKYRSANGALDMASMAKAGLDWHAAGQQEQARINAARTPAGSYGWQGGTQGVVSGRGSYRGF